MVWVRGNYLGAAAQLGVGSAGVRLAALGPHRSIQTIITKGIHYMQKYWRGGGYGAKTSYSTGRIDRRSSQRKRDQRNMSLFLWVEDLALRVLRRDELAVGAP